MNDLISRSKLIKLINEQMEKETGSYSKGVNAGLNIVKSIINDKTQTPTAYDIEKVVEKIEVSGKNTDVCISKKNAIEIVKQGCTSDDVCEWRLCDEEANVYDTSCRNQHILIEETPKENNYEYCPYCGKKIKVVDK